MPGHGSGLIASSKLTELSSLCKLNLKSKKLGNVNARAEAIIFKKMDKLMPCVDKY